MAGKVLEPQGPMVGLWIPLKEIQPPSRLLHINSRPDTINDNHEQLTIHHEAHKNSPTKDHPFESSSM